jgi:hypothetical protein
MKQAVVPQNFVVAKDRRPWHIDEDVFNSMKTGYWDQFMEKGGVVLYCKPSDATRELVGSITLRPLTKNAQDEAGDGEKQADVFVPGDILDECLTFDRGYQDIKRKD